jgi:hypothetical protein
MLEIYFALIFLYVCICHSLKYIIYILVLLYCIDFDLLNLLFKVLKSIEKREYIYI